MIDFRYHLVSIVAIFLALALGIVLGSTTLSNSVGDTLRKQVSSATRSAQEARVQQRQLHKEAAGREGRAGGGVWAGCKQAVGQLGSRERACAGQRRLAQQRAGQQRRVSVQ